jgi:GntR family transcriptional regulator
METAEVPHTLYHFYQTEFNLTVQNTHDEIKAVIAGVDVAEKLGITASEPVLKFTRLTNSLSGKLIEYRESFCRSDKYHYAVDLG